MAMWYEDLWTCRQVLQSAKSDVPMHMKARIFSNFVDFFFSIDVTELIVSDCNELMCELNEAVKSDISSSFSDSKPSYYE